jgi:ADP-ribosylglycohydrolase
MGYPNMPDFRRWTDLIARYAELQHEYGAGGIAPILAGAEAGLKASLVKLQRLRPDRALARCEPNDLRHIRRLRPSGPRRLERGLDRETYREKLEGALLARMAGCTLGAPVEGWPVAKMEDLAKENGEPFPPVDYWKRVRRKLDGVPADDDIMYTLLGLLIVEDFGLDFTTADVARAWLKYLPHAFTAEAVTLENLRNGISADRAAEKENPYCEWIGADIRADPWGYLAPGWPEKAAEFAWRDASLSHRRNGIYGEMFFAAAISAAFMVDHPIEALEIALTEIPRQCALAREIRWALRRAPRVHDYRQAREAVDQRYKGMHGVHTINNAVLTTWGLSIGGTDVTRVIGQTVAMGLDNDCTAATAGSIVGAIVGRQGVPRHWYRNFHDTVLSYLTGKPKFRINDLAARFMRQAERATAT